MGVDTQADVHLDQAAANIQNAIKNLSALVVDRCWGHDEYNAEYLKTIREVYSSLIELNDKLGR